MNPAGSAAVLSAALFVGLIVCLEIGFRLGLARSRSNADLRHEGIGAIEAAVFALLGLLLAFSFAGATSRLDNRRELIVKEANAIGTAYLRLDLLSPEDQTGMRERFRSYLDARLKAYDALPDLKVTEQEFLRCSEIQQEIWTQAVAASKRDATHNSARLLLPALNDMIDVTTSRGISLRTHLPRLVLALQLCVALLSGLLAGFALAKRQHRSWLHMLVYAAIISVTVYTVLDLDSPRSGLIRLDAADNAMRQLRQSIR
jgi:hypothetical protein